ncbi:hypothetical protein [Larsenimonas rhizosphaerae]|nr:hypothetical protein [Larsenimonas rhizosphaerae]
MAAGTAGSLAGTDAALETAIQGGSFSDAVTHNQVKVLEDVKW